MAGLEPGEVFAGRYEIRQPLGHGDRKLTYLAHDKKVDRLVAVSLVRPEAILSDPGGTEREARILGRIGSHVNIVSLYDYETGADRSVQYMVFEYLSGGTLADYLRSAGRPPLEGILRLGRQLCRGLAHLHGKGLIHRDVSPTNIWFDERHVAHLGDFDSAITTNDTGDRRPLTTNSFAAPEEREGGAVDARSDLFSLGGVLYVVATGATSPEGLDLLRSERPDLPSGFAELVGSLLAELPDDRPADAGRVLELLDEIRHASNIDTLIAAGENDKVEFKASLHHAYDELPPDLEGKVNSGTMQPRQAVKELQKRLNKAITKTVAAFLNSEGGTLLVGVSDSGAVLGVEADFPYLKQGRQDSDGWLQSLKTVAVNALGDDIWSAIHAELVPRGQGTVAVVRCPPRSCETWHKEDSGEVFYYRASNTTEALSGPGLLKYVRERWPS